MNRKEFDNKVLQEIEKLTEEQMVLFAWRCAARALPLLGSTGSFDFWGKIDRQIFIYDILFAVDISAATATFTHTVRIPHVIDRAVLAARRTILSGQKALDAAALSAPFSSAYSTSLAAAYAAYTGESTTPTSRAARAASEAREAAKKKMNLEDTILQDLNNIKNKEEENQPKVTDLYGEIWDNFQKALADEGCAYWGKLYQSIFDNGVKLNQEALERRMNVPKEIREQGAARVANYLEELEKGAKRLNEARIIILGDKGAGKTCIARRLIDPMAPMTTDAESTAGVDTTLWKLENENINVRIWDFSGHTVTHAVHQFFLSERCLYIMVYDGRTEERNRLEYWLNHMKNYGGDSNAMILVNKRDQHPVDIPINSLKEQYPIAGFYTFSIKSDKNDLKAFRNDVAGYIENNPSWNKQIIPANYYPVKEELERRFVKGDKEKGEEHITKEEFEKIAEKHDVADTDQLLKNLDALGVSLWYEDMKEFDTLVLNPEWISHGVYKIINWVSDAAKPSLTLADFAKVFKEDANRYPKNKHEFLFKLMKHYELAYETAKGKSLIIPHLLNEDRPGTLPDFPIEQSLMLRYKAEQPLPPHTISRFIVRHNQQIKKEKEEYLAWRYGVVLNDRKGSHALVREKDRSISVAVKGKDKTNYISTLRETLNDIFDSYKSRSRNCSIGLNDFLMK